MSCKIFWWYNKILREIFFEKRKNFNSIWLVPRVIGLFHSVKFYFLFSLSLYLSLSSVAVSDMLRILVDGYSDFISLSLFSSLHLYMELTSWDLCGIEPRPQGLFLNQFISRKIGDQLALTNTYKGKLSLLPSLVLN